MPTFIEPLAADLWFGRIRKIADRELIDVERALRHASHLLQLTPIPFRHVFKLAIDEESFEALLAAGDFDTAAHHLITRPAALTLEEQAGQASFRATISCQFLGRPVHGTGVTAAAAILAAWTSCLLALEGIDKSQSTSHFARKGRHEPDRRLS